MSYGKKHRHGVMMMMIVEMQNTTRGYSLFAPDVQRRSATTTRTPRTNRQRSRQTSRRLHHHPLRRTPRPLGPTATPPRVSPTSIFQWFSPTHPLDPSLFHSLERYPTSHSFVSFPEDSKDCVFEGRHKLGSHCNHR